MKAISLMFTIALGLIFSLCNVLYAKNPHIDRFGNVRCDLTSVSEIEHKRVVGEAIQMQKEQEELGIPSGIAFYGDTSGLSFSEEITHLGLLNETYGFDENINIPEGTSVNLMRLSATAPETIYIENEINIFSSHVVYLVSKEDRRYFLVVKDKTKPRAMVPGGTQSRQEKNNFMLTAVRELAEETSGERIRTTKTLF